MLPKGTKLVCTAHWDNSDQNLSNPDPNKTVTWGDQTFEEMMIGFYVEVFPKGQMPARPSGGRSLEQFTPKKVLAAFDANRNGKLTKDEMPGRFAERFELIDQDHDGEVNKQELEMRAPLACRVAELEWSVFYFINSCLFRDAPDKDRLRIWETFLCRGC